ncbi:calmodulin-binding transcription activator 1-like isoform X2 [Magnolia sinica]|uniref:calmodulin-binding transcription activator 1-like isoform X2 n=1 Tax=Magnolia sinica TaxID=86752 RepID=UPI0026596BA6|nr:calmodulin-binding transcription activator 1-like isoform X2 [Magnolia sinica]
MADSRRYGLNPQLDISQILSEAQNRWLRPSEVCEILRNYQKFSVTPDPPYKPPSGSLFLFDRKALRYFRKDGHRWRKKRDGKTVREAHEKLKSGSVDVLHCYYAHGEDNENFQRRSYWMLDGQLEHIVLVHYREVKEGNRSGFSRLLNTDPGTLNYAGGSQTCSVPCSAQAHSPALAAQPSYASSPSTANWNGQARSSELEDVDSGDDYGVSSLSGPVSCSGFQIASSHVNNSINKNTLESRGTASHAYARGLAAAAGMNNRLHDPFNVNQVAPPSLVANEGYQTSYGASQESGFSESSRKQLGAALFGGTSFNHDVFSSTWSESLKSNRNIASMHEEKISFDQPYGADFIARKLTDSSLDPYSRTLIGDAVQVHAKEENAEHVDFASDNHTENDMNYINTVRHKPDFHSNPQCENKVGSSANITASDRSLGFEAEGHQSLKNAPESGLCNDGVALKKLDSFGRWMSKEIGKDCDDSLMASDSCNYWNSIDTQNDEKEVSSLSRHMQLDVDSLGPFLSQEQLFSIVDFSPDWSFRGVETKVLISGTFLGGRGHPSSTKWCCMFGEIEVSVEVLTNNALRCQAPAHAPGRVPFYITCSNRLACSEVREFEYRENPSGTTSSVAVKNELQDEICLQIRLAKMLSLGVDKKWLDCSMEKCEKCILNRDILSMRGDDVTEWGMVEKASKALGGNVENPREALIQKLLKNRLYEWLVCKVHEGGKGPNILDDDGQGVIHLAAALGYDWAMGPVVAAGVSPSFRDARGRTGLHWAAYFGREETVISLVRLGAAPGAVEDPTSSFPEARTAADLASSRGHKGIAGYLAEADLTSHNSSLRLNESIADGVSATLAAEKAIEIVQEQSIVPLDGDKDSLSLKGPLAAVRNSALAAARIQSAFRVHSFRQRQLAKCSDENSEISSELVVLASMNNRAKKVGHFSDSLNAAAVRIQQKYRGWKGRKEFLKIRSRIVKIQAHVRGHQVRKQYKKVVWSVGIVEKAILRWRRKGTGLRGFRADKAIGDADPNSGKIDEYEFLRIGRKQKEAGVEKALSRVRSMVRSQEARDQYNRLVTNFQKLEMMDGEAKGSIKIRTLEEHKADENLGMPD